MERRGASASGSRWQGGSTANQVIPEPAGVFAKKMMGRSSRFFGLQCADDNHSILIQAIEPWAPSTQLHCG